MKMLLLYFALNVVPCLLRGQDLKINISGLRNTKGSVRLAFYTSQQAFDNDQPLFTKIVSKEQAVKGAVTATYSGIKPGTYGIAILDDENNDQKMNYGLVLPKEGFGFSNYYHTGMTRPKFAQFDFIFPGASPVEIRVRYL